MGAKKIKKIRQRQGQHDGGSAAVSLPEDVIFDVLSRFPAKPLCRFRCVSKAWRTFISDPAFIAAQRSRGGPQFIAVFRGPPKPLVYQPSGNTVHRDTPVELRVMDMYGNVLRILKDVEPTKLQRTRLDLVFLDDELFGAAAGAFDPATGRVVRISEEYLDEFCSFGRATPSGLYKAVRLHDKFCQIATLYEGGGGELMWRQGPAAPFLRCCSSQRTPTVDGVLYFMPCRSHCLNRDQNRGVAAFDLQTEEWNPAIQFPEEDTQPASLLELNGTLAMVSCQQIQMNVWLLVDSEKRIWVKQHVIQSHESWRFVKPLEVLSDGRMLLLANFVEVRKQDSPCSTLRWIFQLRDPNTGAHTDLVEMPAEFKGQMALYRGSLLY